MLATIEFQGMVKNDSREYPLKFVNKYKWFLEAGLLKIIPIKLFRTVNEGKSFHPL